MADWPTSTRLSTADDGRGRDRRSELSALAAIPAAADQSPSRPSRAPPQLPTASTPL